MAHLKTRIIKNKWMSLLSRVATVLIITGSSLITAAVSLQYFYQGEVDHYFVDQENLEETLIIQSGRHGLRAYGQSKENFRPLLDAQLGQYQSHKFIGWHADFTQLLKGEGFPFFMLYEVSYQKGMTQEYFSYSGLLAPRLLAREVHLN